MPGYHSLLSPSKAHRWRPCPASIAACVGLPDTAGEEAHQGTVFHDFAAPCVEFDVPPSNMIGSRLLCEDGVSREFTKEMATKMLPGLDLLNSLSNAPGAVLLVEQWVDTSPWVGEGEGGTSDAMVIDTKRKWLTIFDWKWGAGVPVTPQWNDQGIIYLLGVWNSFAKALFDAAGVDANEITVSIIIEQPRAPGGGGVWEIPLRTLLAEGRQIRKDADATREPDAPFNPGTKQCQFCPAARHNTCKARTKKIANILGIEDLLDEAPARVEAEDVMELVDLRSMTPEERSYVLLNQKMITKWLTQLYEEAMDDAVKGRPVPGLKRVRGRAGRRKWKDDKKAEIILRGELGSDAFQKKLLSPAMAEDEVGKAEYRERYARHVEQTLASPALVPESDPKPALGSAKDMLTMDDVG